MMSIRRNKSYNRPAFEYSAGPRLTASPDNSTASARYYSEKHCTEYERLSQGCRNNKLNILLM
jgi:hypothetical protein